MEEKKVNQSDFSAYTILQKKSQGKQLTAQEIKWFINGLLSGEIPDYQMTALLMAIHINGLMQKKPVHLQMLCFIQEQF